ncbi:MAG TPA: hypothetical protein PKX23_03755 [Verrucomicrobiota bacterium]|jgi:hypothetical protein|nr:hypothetical protein [Verrucomicrobiota bacterium]HRT07026.1 hypothetical protein [Candidatus Paceibacterota bacterium]HRT55519.1 hypothetical protein [Candidatus Paceibacterota bacterium]
MKRILALVPIVLMVFTAAFVAGRWSVATARVKAQAPPPVAPPSREPMREPEGETIIPFHWSRLESTNYATYADNLRAVGCPEAVLTAIIQADLTRAYAPRFAEASKAVAGLPLPEVEKQRRHAEIKREIESILYDQLRLQRPERQAHSRFAAQQEEKIAEAWRLFPQPQADPTNPESIAQARSNREARLQFLSQHLSADELLYYKLEREGDARRVEMLLAGMQPTKEEFLRVAAAVGNRDVRAVNGKLPDDVREILQGVLSPERFALLMDLQRPEYRAIVFNAILPFDLAPDVASRLVALRRNTYPTDPASYAEAVKALLEPSQAQWYLNNKLIHPDASP